MDTRFCISCGEPFQTDRKDAALCPNCGGGMEAPRRQPIELTRPETALAEKAPRPASASPGSVIGWQAGDVILDTYEVKGLLGTGGMGRVYRVHHKSWNIDLALKSPKPEIFAKAGGRESFIREAETWVDLGLHPHIVSCYYVRTIDEIPRLFAELVEGGSLKDWIEDGRLYEGGKEKALQRILDIAIQFAWGLQYAHEQGLVHQDVKPANVLMTPDGIAKVTDFGLARARAAAGEKYYPWIGKDILVSAGGMTRAYCSPEQARGEKLSPKTDIWSWGVSILELFIGEVTWVSGVAALEALEIYAEQGPVDPRIPELPGVLAALLRQSFRQEPEDRPKDMREVIRRLKGFYQQLTGKPFSRPAPEPATLQADNLNNKALSMLDLGQDSRATEAWKSALASDPANLEANYNFGLYQWRSAQVTDERFIQQLEGTIAAQAEKGRGQYLLGLAHLERGDGASARKAFQAATALAHTAKVTDGEPLFALEHRLAEQLPLAACLATYQEKVGSIEAIAVTSDRGRFVTGSSVNIFSGLQLWDLKEGKCLHKFNGIHENIHWVVISPDNRMVLSAGQGSAIKAWDLESGKLLYQLEGHTDTVHSIAWLPGKQQVISGGKDCTVRWWDLATRRCLGAFQGHERPILRVAAHPDGRRFLSASGDKTLRLWDLASGRCLQVFKGHQNIVSCLALSPDGRLALSGDWDKFLILWDLEQLEQVRKLTPYPESRGEMARSAVVISSDGRQAISGGEDRQIRLWELSSGRCLRSLSGHSNAITCLALVPGTTQVLSGSADGTIRLWDMQGPGARVGIWAVSRPVSAGAAVQVQKQALEKITQARQALKNGRFQVAGELLAEARRLPGYEHNPQLLAAWREAGERGGRRSGLRSVRGVRTLEGQHKDIRCLAISQDGKTILSGDDHVVLIWDFELGRTRGVLWGREEHVYYDQVAISPGGVGVSCGMKEMKWWNLSNAVCTRTENRMGKGVSIGMLLQPDGKPVITAGGKTGSLWDVDSGRLLRAYKLILPEGQNLAEGFKEVSLSPGCTQLARAKWKNSTVYVWDTATGNLIAQLTGHQGEITALGFTPDGRKLISSSQDETMRAWDTTNWRCLRCWPGQASRLAISPNSRVAMTSHEQILEVWDLETGERLERLEGHSQPITGIVIAPNGHYAISSSHDRTLRIWELDWDYEFPEPVDWDESARPYLEAFLDLHTCYASALPKDHIPTDQEILLVASGQAKPAWGEADFQQLLVELGYRGYGWLRPDGVRRKLEEMAALRS